MVPQWRPRRHRRTVFAAERRMAADRSRRGAAADGYWTGTLRRASRNAAVLGLGSAVVVICWVAAYAWLGAVGDWYYAVIRWPLERYGNVNAMPYAFALREWIVPWLWDVAHTL